MSYQPFYISNFEPGSGIDTYHEPFMVPEKAFPVMENLFCWRGRIKRKRGFNKLAQLQRVLTNLSLTAATGAGTYTNADVLSSVRATEPNAEIAPSTVTLTIARGTGNETIYTDDGAGTLTYVSGPYTISAGSINYATGAISLTFTVAPPAATTVDISMTYYPSLPVMGLSVYETTAINEEDLIAFDTKYAYRFSGGIFTRIGTTTTWNGTDANFFWTHNYFKNANGKILWVTNFNLGATRDPIRYWDSAGWTTFNPIVRADNAATPTRLQQAKCIVAYKGRLLAFYTHEGSALTSTTAFPQRMRWSQNGTPLTIGTVGAGPVWTTVGAWADDLVGYGGYVDAPTTEQIVSVEFIKDTLLVKFERSSWKVVYTGNEQLPFVFEKINTELGSESTFSLVPFDNGVLAFGNYGITTDDSVNVARIDTQIPNFILNVNNDFDGVERVHGVRDFANELVYWCYPRQANDSKFPNRVLVYNYVNSSYAIFKDSFTTFAQYQRTSDKTWSSYTSTRWGGASFRWDTGAFQSFYPDVVAGNQQGYVLVLSQKIGNDSSLTIKTITPNATNPVQIGIPNHNLEDNDIIKITGVLSTGASNPLTVLNDEIYKVIVLGSDTITLQLYNSSTGIFDDVIIDVGSTYIGNGRVEYFNNINLVTKRFSPYYEVGGQTRLAYIDFLLSKTTDGEVTNRITIDENTSISVSNLFASTTPTGVANSGLLGDDVLLTRPENLDLLPIQKNQDKIWHRFYVQAICQNFQIQLTMDDLQMIDENISKADFQLHATVFYLSKNSRLIQ